MNKIHKNIEQYDYTKLEELLEDLLKNGKLKKYINQKNFEGLTPLHCAVINNNQQCVQQLINYGADINIPTNDGYKIKWSNDNKQTGGNINKQTGCNINKQTGGTHNIKIIGKRYL